MASAAQLDGVAQLQVAKAAATAKIEEARTRRIKKLKQAKSEAAVEANLYKAECEAAIKELEQRHSKHNIETGGRVEAFTEQAIQRLQQRYEENKETALGEIIAQVLTVNPVVHRNAKNVQ
ncbi:V-type proton ATPase subunit G [Echinococcus granulosus]|uniref:V-type proton ATPase subunit G n=1 Tax=Echinococcus granulosus TaxID=6210 RepID=W6V149_ECHGR|nr:V-type proton ATPase subunit G [Echinococcus granulosus]EUB64637.1 V-type proton ATPase subunit G [Echinococcus granulosus]